MNPAAVLLCFREGHATDLKNLHLAFGFPPERLSTAGSELDNIVRDLIGVGLLQADRKDLFKAKISVTALLPQFQNALGISIKFLASFEPLFGLPKTLVEPLDVFVLMPFKDEMLPVYEDHIKPICARLQLAVRRADDFFTANSVVEDIWTGITNARLILADCTDRNPNVFYEIGIAHAIGKPTILLTQKTEDVPSDLRHLRYIAYQLTPRGMQKFEKTFIDTVDEVLKLSRRDVLRESYRLAK